MAAWMGRAAVSVPSGSTGLFGLLEWSENAVPCSTEPPAQAKALPHTGLAAADPLSPKAEASESQCWEEDSALIIKSSSKRS